MFLLTNLSGEWTGLTISLISGPSPASHGLRILDFIHNLAGLPIPGAMWKKKHSFGVILTQVEISSQPLTSRYMSAQFIFLSSTFLLYEMGTILLPLL